MTLAAGESSSEQLELPPLAERPGGELPRWVWLWLPPVLVLAMVLVRALDHDSYNRWFERKEGPKIGTRAPRASTGYTWAACPDGYCRLNGTSNARDEDNCIPRT